MNGYQPQAIYVIMLVMVITHHGGQCFKVTFGDTTLVFDPISKAGTLPPVRFGADITLVSRAHPDFNGVESVTYNGKEPFLIQGPGEYEKEGITIQGFLTKSNYTPTSITKRVPLVKNTKTEAINTIYSVKLEGMTLVHLGALSDTTLPLDAREGIEEVDVLFLPVGGEGVLSPAEASKVATFLEPKIIIPMHWSGMGEKGALETFIKEHGGEGERVDKLTLKKKDVSDKSGSIITITA
jgi:L-ascorbate metabolism protein UlaG (beta-lactamase superfamily)